MNVLFSKQSLSLIEKGLICRKYSFYCTSCGDLDLLGEVSRLSEIDLSFRKGLFSRIATFMGICFDIKIILCMHYDYFTLLQRCNYARYFSFRNDVMSLEA